MKFNDLMSKWRDEAKYILEKCANKLFMSDHRVLNNSESAKTIPQPPQTEICSFCRSAGGFDGVNGIGTRLICENCGGTGKLPETIN